MWLGKVLRRQSMQEPKRLQLVGEDALRFWKAGNARSEGGEIVLAMNDGRVIDAVAVIFREG